MPTPYTPKIEGSDLAQFTRMLQRAGYEPDTDLEVGPEQLGHKEYQCYNVGMQIMLVLPEGESGDTDSYTNFYFSLETEAFKTHGCCNDNA